MKSKFTFILMLFIIVLIIGATGLLGMIVWEEIQNYLPQDESNVPKMEDFAEKDNTNTEVADIPEENIEVPKIRNTTNNVNKAKVDNDVNPLTELSKPVSSNTVTQEQEEQVENVSGNKYFYNQLNNYSKKIYSALETNKENMKTGTYKINLGSSFSDILSKSNGQDELGNYYQSAIEAYVYDNPDVFYLSPSKMYLNIETITRGNQKTYNTYIDNGEGANYLIEEFNSKNEVEQALSALENVRNNIISNKTGDTYKDIKMVHDYLVNNIDYDRTVSEANIFNIYGALINHKCVCEGYAKALKYLLDGLGIEAVLVIGKATNSEGESENHAWNYVNVDGTWYAIDSTWDDPVIIGGGTLTNSSKYKYFLKGTSVMNKDHFPSGRFTENGMVFEYPNLSSSNY
ncbi:MAG: hypothetical protein IKF38_00650 [Clostridia bacterium]|nr:hypothetical protein [Clostridia bacterium]